MSSVGRPVDSAAAPRPGRVTLSGSYVTVTPLDPPRHAAALFEATRGHDDVWTYLFEGPFADRGEFDAYLSRKAVSSDPLFFTFIERATGRPAGHAAFMRMEPAHRVIEVGSILFVPGFQRTRGSTEAMFLMARHVFDDLGYRRYEWKCDALNEPSRRAALRLGFVYEGIFRQHMIVKGRNRDTAWFSMLDLEWPSRRRAFERWLEPSNFDADGRQRATLASLHG